MFWGFVLEPKKRYNTTVTKPFHISMAALDLKSINDDDVNTLVLNVDGTETILCHLTKPHYLQQRLDLNFIEGNTITLEVKGKAVVHLSGYFIYEQDGMDEEDDDSDLEDEEEEVDSHATARALKALKKQMGKKSKFNASTTEEDSDEDDDSDESGDESMDVSDMTFDDDDDDEDDDEEDDEEEDEEEEDDEEEEEITKGSPGSTPMPPLKKGKGASANNTPVSSKKNKQQQQQQESGKKNKGDKQQQQQSPQKPLSNGNAPGTPGSNKKKKNKENGAATPNNKQDTPNNSKQATPTPKKSLEGGVIVEDIKVGGGVPAKSGKMVSVFYVGKLKSNNKQFDSTTQGPGFKFRLGKGEVIKGWDVGLSGMKVGGKRRITIPAHMAYGIKGSPPAIPPNSTLVFDVELKNVN